MGPLLRLTHLETLSLCFSFFLAVSPSPSHALPTSHGSLQVPAAGPRLMREASLAVGDLGVVEYMEGYGRG